MPIPLQITYRDVPASRRADAWIRAMAEKLEKFHDRIVGCRVVVEEPHKHGAKGRIYHVTVDVSVPGGEIVANRDESYNHAHEDLYVAIKDAFKAAERRLHEMLQLQRGEIKRHGAERPVVPVVKFP